MHELSGLDAPLAKLRSHSRLSLLSAASVKLRQTSDNSEHDLMQSEDPTRLHLSAFFGLQEPYAPRNRAATRASADGIHREIYTGCA